ncbi:MAG: TM2 domain-containing protein [Deltaproteobacteria bacterium]|nr:TM2 domain-containing protein [Deltaproteobacteria bacterium]
MATVLCFFLGGLGVHRFYAGKIVTAIIMLLTLGGFGIWTAIDLIYLICGKFTDSKGFPINYIGAPRLAIVLICIFLFIVLALIVFTVYGIYVI